ncbi:hypothetical protein GGI25_000088 [Coemansia spiralis]|uniref:Uncharacterized protein n=2 Tax=Coemansia TaxID=4863 RepID=A0A9W8L1P8_9FUNG|nr:HCNGP-like protein-domain-containing protein [Coemansia spiralis]KAJ1992587.1 hypothetical protein EDC05_002733 [Coemansia umbellata]KAJ2623033.1 hypothetical protein GGI26_002642 [Coemansia sp. RSA 1358]KAJ2681133.1 hypothetical protein GGI25_000088 [Coemansia spiralis]
MDTQSENALLAALGSYGSDIEGSSDTESSSGNSEAVLPQQQLQEVQPDAIVESCSEDTAKDTNEDDFSNRTKQCTNNVETAYSGVSEEQLAVYKETKHKLNKLLGCDQIPDFSPPSDAKACPTELQAKFAQWHALKHQGANFNEALMRNKSFRNPNIYSRLVGHLHLEETGSNFPPDGFDSATLRSDFTPKNLEIEHERRAREQLSRKTAEHAANFTRKVQFQSGGYENTQLDSEQTRNGRSFEEAIQRAKQIAQHLARAKK